MLHDESLPSLEDFARLFQHEFGTPKLSVIASENPALLKAFKNFHPVRMATTFASLLTHPGLQSNCVDGVVAYAKPTTRCKSPSCVGAT